MIVDLKEMQVVFYPERQCRKPLEGAKKVRERPHGGYL
jgi:hypothetical protein